MKKSILKMVVLFVVIVILLVVWSALNIGMLNNLFWVLLLIVSVFGIPFLSIYFIQQKILTKNRKKKIIIPILKPYKNIHPIIAGYIINNKLDIQDLLAGLFFLEHENFILIEKKAEGYLFKLKK